MFERYTEKARRVIFFARYEASQWPRTAEAAHDIVKIHSEEWDVSYVQAQVVELRKFVWRKRQWKPLDVMVEIISGRISFDMTLKDDLGLKVVAGGWSRESCSLCHWELNAGGAPDHASGYSNGREWLCIECHEKFLEPLDKASE
jgi:hypothetical protein